MESTPVNPLPGLRALAGLYFALKGAVTFMVLAFSSLFLEVYGAAGWPWFLITFTLVFIGTQMWMMPRPDWKGRRFLDRFLLPLTLVSLVLAAIGGRQAAVVVFLALVGFRAFELHSIQAFFDLAGQILPLQASKKYIPLIMAFGMTGSIMAGLFLKFLLPEVGFSGLFIMSAVLFFAGSRFLGRLASHAESAAPAKAASAPGTSGGLWDEGVPVVYRHYCFAIVVISMMGSLVLTLLDYQFKGSLPEFFPKAAEMASFLGMVNAGIDFTVLIIQGTLGGWLFSRLPLGMIIGVRPGVVAAAALLAFWLPILPTLVAAQYTTMVLTYIFMAPVWVLLLEPLPQATRLYARRILNIADCVIVLGLGLGLLAYGSLGGGPAPVILLLISILALLTYIGNGQVLRLYPEMIRATLSSSRLADNLEGLPGLRFLPLGDRIAHLKRLAESAEPDLRSQAVMAAGGLDTEEASRLVCDLLTRETNPRVVGAAIRALAGSSSGREQLRRFLETDLEPRLKADILEMAGTVPHPENDRLFLTFLDHPHHRVRGGAILGYLRYGRDRTEIPRVLARLEDGIRSPDPLDRSTSAVILGRIGLPELVPALFLLADDDREEVARCAFRALAALRLPGILEFLAERMADPGARGKMATEAWEQASNQDQEAVVRILSGMTDEERRRTGFWLRALQSGLPADTLGRVLKISDSLVRSGILEVLADRNPEKIRVATACLQGSEREGALDPLPLIRELENWEASSPSPLIDLVPFICGTSCPPLKEFIVGRLRNMAWTFGLLFLAKTVIPDRAPPSCMDAQERKWRNLLPLLAGGGEDPASLLDALRKAEQGDSFVSSVATEYLQEKLGRELCSLVIPISERRRNPGALLAAIPACGLPDPRALATDELLHHVEALA